MTYIDFVQDLASHQVSLSPAKKSKYLHVVSAWKAWSHYTLIDIKRLYGKLLHTCLVIPSGHAYLTHLEVMLTTGYHHPYVPQLANKGIPPDLDWWLPVLQQPSLSRSISAPVWPLSVNTLSDVSSEVSIAIIVHGRWRAWQHIPDWKTLCGQCNIGWAEAVGFECIVCFLIESTLDPLVGTSPSTGITKAWSKAGGMAEVRTVETPQTSSEANITKA